MALAPTMRAVATGKDLVDRDASESGTIATLHSVGIRARPLGSARAYFNPIGSPPVYSYLYS